MHKTARKGLFVWLIRLVLAALILLLLSLELLREVPLAGLAISGLTLVLLAFFGLFYLPAYFKRYYFSLSEDTMLLRTGVFIRRVTVLPYRRMIMVTRLETPLTALFGVCLAVVTLPGGRLWIACLLRSEAARLSAHAGEELWDETV